MTIALIIVSFVGIVLAVVLGYILYLLSHLMDGW